MISRDRGHSKGRAGGGGGGQLPFGIIPKIHPLQLCKKFHIVEVHRKKIVSEDYDQCMAVNLSTYGLDFEMTLPPPLWHFPENSSHLAQN